MKIEYYHEQKWGNDYIYINDEKTANLIYLLTRRKTVTPSEIKILEKLGFEMTQIINPKFN